MASNRSNSSKAFAGRFDCFFSRQERIAELRRSIAEEKERFAARCKELRDLEKAETESVGSMGVSNLDIDGKGSEPMDEDEEKLLAISGDEAPKGAGKE